MKGFNPQALVNGASAAHAPAAPASNPGAGLVAEGMRPVDATGNAAAHDRGNHDHSNAPKHDPQRIGGSR
ncbi:hypothetical protein [Dokdonella fugitiva]|uniref:Uncharacterized protein n=1 Tax=Dokdonella fugitiva TaxID=328517 RepID=A0A4R2I8R0_9GAMM|nr:hypothetical protein [Dokdonella fugitiva]TCO40432.1 hypothetical protein EV148_105227 [Dokdonella fugitiva]